jgi:hypothetical protein
MPFVNTSVVAVSVVKVAAAGVVFPITPGADMMEGMFDGTRAKLVRAFAAASPLVAICMIPATDVLAAGAPKVINPATPAGVQTNVLLVPAIVSAVVASSTIPAFDVLAGPEPR